MFNLIYSIFLFYFLIFGISFSFGLENNSIITDKNYTYIIDGFEIKNEWEVKYYSSYINSRYSKNFVKFENKDKASLIRSSFKWFSFDDKNLKQYNFLSPFVSYKDNFYKVNNKDYKDKQKTILGIKTKWNLPFYSYIDVVPRKVANNSNNNRYSSNNLGRYPDQMLSFDSLESEHHKLYIGKPYILLPGYLSTISLYVLSSYYPADIEFHVEDKLGTLHVLKAGSLYYNGWRKLSASLPKRLLGRNFYTKRTFPLKFKAIRIVPNYSRLEKFYYFNKDKISYLYFDFLYANSRISLDHSYSTDLNFAGEIWRNISSEKNQNQAG